MDKEVFQEELQALTEEARDIDAIDNSEEKLAKSLTLFQSLAGKVSDFFAKSKKNKKDNDDDEDDDDDEDEDEDDDAKAIAKALAALETDEPILADDETLDAWPLLKSIADRDARTEKVLRGIRKSLARIDERLVTVEQGATEKDEMVKSVCAYIEGKRRGPDPTPMGSAFPDSDGILVKSLQGLPEISEQKVRFGLSDEQLVKGLWAHMNAGKHRESNIPVDFTTITNTPIAERPQKWYEAAATELGMTLKDE